VKGSDEIGGSGRGAFTENQSSRLEVRDHADSVEQSFLNCPCGLKLHVNEGRMTDGGAKHHQSSES
jgi:hypothetical protein